MPLFSIVTVCKNDFSRLLLTIESVIDSKSRYPGIIEFIVVDGNSVDGTSRLLDDYDWVIDRSVSGDDCGLYDAMNIGSRLASTPWLLFLNSGDTLHLSKDVIGCLSNLAENDSLGYIVFDVIQYYNNGVSRLFRAGSPSRLRNGSQFSHQGVLMRKSNLLELPFNLEYRYCADFHHFLTQYRNNPSAFYMVPKVLAAVEAGGLSDSFRLKIIDEWISILRTEYQSWPYSLLFKKAIFLLLRPFWGIRPRAIALWARCKSFFNTLP